MSQEWDIDDILASLDELLQEDDKPNAKVNRAPKKRPAMPIVQAKQDDGLAPVDSQKVKKPPTSDTSKKTQAKEPVLSAPRPIDIDVPDADFRQEPGMDADMAPVVPRVLLTKDMLVDAGDAAMQDTAFDSLSAAMDDDDLEPEPEQLADASVASDKALGVHLNAQQTEQMLELVAMDVSYQFNQMLPDMIRKSLKTHMTLIQHKNSKE